MHLRQQLGRMYTRRRQSVRRNRWFGRVPFQARVKTLQHHRSGRIQQGRLEGFGVEGSLMRSPSPVERVYLLNPRPWRIQLVSPLAINPRSRVPDAADSSISFAMRLRPSNVAPALTTKTGAWTSPLTQPVG